MSDPDQSDADRLKRLEERIAAARGVGAELVSQKADYSQADMAWRMVIELVAGLGIGFGIGYGLDQLFRTTPILLVLFVFLGLAAGVKTMLRTAKDIQNKAAKAAAQEGDGRG